VSYLGAILDQVRQSDISLFREKVETMEKAKKEQLMDQGFANIDMIMESKHGKMAEPEKREQKQQETQETKMDEDAFTKFLQSIRG
jgi:hypothetical protein